MTYLIALAAALLPAIPLVQVSTAQLAKARSYWLLGTLTLGIVWLAQYELWLALIGLAFLCRWRSPVVLGSLVAWVGIGASWFLLLRVPVWMFDYVAWTWLAVALWNVVLLFDRYRRIKVRMVGTFGSPPLTAFFIAVVLPLSPWWTWPVLAAGLFFTSSILAGLGVAVAVVWLHPWTWWLWLGAGVLIVASWALSPLFRGRRFWEWTLRGDTLDSVWARCYAARLVIHELTRTGQWTLGAGPNSASLMLRRWGSRLRIELPHEVSNEFAHQVYEYGTVGGLAALAFAWRVGSHLHLGDPWSAAWLAVMVISLSHWPLRHPVLGPAWLVISARIVLA